MVGFKNYLRINESKISLGQKSVSWGFIQKNWDKLGSKIFRVKTIKNLSGPKFQDQKCLGSNNSFV